MVMEALKTSNVVVNTGPKLVLNFKILISRSLSLFDLTYNSLEKAPLARCCSLFDLIQSLHGRRPGPQGVVENNQIYHNY